MVGWGVGNHTFSVWKKINFVSFWPKNSQTLWYPQLVCWYRRKYLTHSLTHMFIPCLLSIIAYGRPCIGSERHREGQWVVSDSLQPRGLWSTKLLCPLDFPWTMANCPHLLPFVLCFQWLTDTWTITLVCYISFQWLLSQITTSFVTHSNTNILSYKVLRSEAQYGSQWTKIKVLEDCGSSWGSGGEFNYLPFPGSRGCLHSLDDGPTSLDLLYPLSHPSLSHFCLLLQNLRVIGATLDNPVKKS